MQYLLTKEFTKINETSGTIQNASRINSVEISDTPTAGSGYILPPLDKISFNGQNIYLRCLTGGGAAVRVVSFIINSGGSSPSSQSSTSEQGDTDDTFDSNVDNIFNGNGSSYSSGDPAFDSDLDNIFSGNGGSSTSGDPAFDSDLDNIFNP